MPTGYTAALDEGISPKTWLKEHLSRAFGMMIWFKEEDSGLSETELQERLEKLTECKWQVENLDEAEAELSKAKERTMDEWEEAIKKENKRREEYEAKSKKETLERAELHSFAASALQLLGENTVDEVTQNVVNFGLNQLKLVERECEYDIFYEQIISSPEGYAAIEIKKLEENVAWQKNNLDEEKERQVDRLQCYKTFVAEVNRILGDDQMKDICDVHNWNSKPDRVELPDKTTCLIKTCLDCGREVVIDQFDTEED